VLFTGSGNLVPGVPKPVAKHLARKARPKKHKRKARHARRANVRRASKATAGVDVGSTKSGR
jgi:hypothetical protein